MKIRPQGADLYVDRQKRHSNCRFSQFCKFSWGFPPPTSMFCVVAILIRKNSCLPSVSTNVKWKVSSIANIHIQTNDGYCAAAQCRNGFVCMPKHTHV